MATFIFLIKIQHAERIGAPAQAGQLFHISSDVVRVVGSHGRQQIGAQIVDLLGRQGKPKDARILPQPLLGRRFGNESRPLLQSPPQQHLRWSDLRVVRFRQLVGQCSNRIAVHQTGLYCCGFLGLFRTRLCILVLFYVVVCRYYCCWLWRSQ